MCEAAVAAQVAAATATHTWKTSHRLLNCNGCTTFADQMGTKQLQPSHTVTKRYGFPTVTERVTNEEMSNKEGERESVMKPGKYPRKGEMCGSSFSKNVKEKVKFGQKQVNVLCSSHGCASDQVPRSST
eukprot:scpid55336/ scgid33822/ 